MGVLADTSIWVDYLRHGAQGPAGHLDELLAAREVVTCGPVLAELLAGARAEQRPLLRRLLASIAWTDLTRALWGSVGEVAAELRAAGVTVALTDIEIAVAAASGDAALWTRDSDFDRIAVALPDLQRYRPPTGR